MDLKCDQAYVTEIAQQMVRINSTNPDLSAQNAGEAEMATYIASLCLTLGLSVSAPEAAPGRPNVIATLRGSGDGPSLMINGHMDTVGVEGMADPFGAQIRNGRLYGRGSQDMKGSLASMLGAVKALLNGGITLKGDLVLAFVADEEVASIGTENVVSQVKTDAAIVTEPTDLAICRAHRGFVWHDITTHGRAAHGSRYDEGIDAIVHMGRFLAEFEAYGKDLLARSPHPLAGPPSTHVSLIEGGSEMSIYPDKCTLNLERRTVPGESVPAVTAELQNILNHLSAADPEFNAEMQTTFDRAPFEVSEEAAIVLALESAVSDKLGPGRPHSGATFWTDAAILASAGIETVLIGPTGAGLHSAEDWVELQSLYDLADILAQTAVSYCGGN